MGVWGVYAEKQKSASCTRSRTKPQPPYSPLFATAFWQGQQSTAYANIGQIPGLHHLTVNHSLNFVDPASGAHTQRIECCWKSAKERNKRHNGTHRSLLDSYKKIKCEFMWRSRVKVRRLCWMLLKRYYRMSSSAGPGLNMYLVTSLLPFLAFCNFQ